MRRLAALVMIITSVAAALGLAVRAEAAGRTAVSAPTATWCIGSAEVGVGRHSVTTPTICVPGP